MIEIHLAFFSLNIFESNVSLVLLFSRVLPCLIRYIWFTIGLWLIRFRLILIAKVIQLVSILPEIGVCGSLWVKIKLWNIILRLLCLLRIWQIFALRELFLRLGFDYFWLFNESTNKIVIESPIFTLLVGKALHHMPHHFQVDQVLFLSFQFWMKNFAIDGAEDLVVFQSLWQHVNHLWWILGLSAFLV